MNISIILPNGTSYPADMNKEFLDYARKTGNNSFTLQGVKTSEEVPPGTFDYVKIFVEESTKYKAIC